MVEISVNRYKLIDAFRGLAILWIACFHLLFAVREQYGAVLSYIITRGNLGVSIFFVISGYGVASSVENYFGKPLLYLWQRFKRIYLPYWWHLLFAALIIPALSALVSTLKSHTFEVDYVNYSIFEWLKVITLAEIFSSTTWKLNLAFLPLSGGVVWFIAIIVQIYLFIFFCLFWDKKYFSSFMFVGFICSLLTNFSIIRDLIPCGFFLPYFSQVYIGYFLYYLLRKGMIPKSNIQIIIMLLCVAPLYYCGITENLSVSENQLLSLCFAIIIGFTFLTLHKYDFQINRFFVVKLLCFMGSFSYSLYLLHMPLWGFVDMFVRNFVPLPPCISYPFFLLPGVIALSFIWSLFFEKASTLNEVARNIYRPIKTINSGVKQLITFF